MEDVDRQAVLDEFDEQGFVVLQGILDPEEDIQPVMDEYECLLDTLSRDWHRDGKISSDFERLPFGSDMSKC